MCVFIWLYLVSHSLSNCNFILNFGFKKKKERKKECRADRKNKKTYLCYVLNKHFDFSKTAVEEEESNKTVCHYHHTNDRSIDRSVQLSIGTIGFYLIIFDLDVLIPLH